MKVGPSASGLSAGDAAARLNALGAIGDAYDGIVAGALVVVAVGVGVVLLLINEVLSVVEG
jgi:hypothetical protein